uniref:Ribosomal protein S11 n=1 Tax=Spumella sp. Baekdong012001B8 TaxID=2782410 RepID=A0A7S6TBZ2_9STRA|nr:ribosomal protein S11 [Spumella sp. Baekdong012001B8]
MVKHRRRKKKQKVAPIGAASIKTTFNNTIITMCDANGNAICWSSAGVVGFKNARKNTPYAAQIAAKNAAIKGRELGLQKVNVYLRGLGNAREATIRAIAAAGLIILSITEKSTISHNGCRPPKRRRV